ncbi:MAG: protein kinase [Pirellulaceae bacterium]|nr:protein kinase [Pirellulaceae bacterium]
MVSSITSDSDSSRSDSSISQPDSLDDALQCVIEALESDQALDRDALLAKFPQWAEDINQFIDNWVSMEQTSSQLVMAQAQDPAQFSIDLHGKVMGDYELLELISSGGMGVVYRARQLTLGRIVALKMVWNALRDKARFRIEAEAAASLHHANIISIHEVGEFEGQPFLCMQFIEGGNLHDRLRKGPLTPDAAARLVQTIAMAVHYAHQRGILHRDLKPANVLLDTDGRPFVTDFGLAKQMGNSVELTRSGAIIGTPGYMAPEQAMGQVKSITVAADVYGLGAILYATLTGEAPFKGDSDLITLRRVIEEPPVSPRTKRIDVDRNLETVCLKCLEKTPGDRYASAKHLADDLARYLRGEPVTARPISRFEQRWRWCLRNPVVATLSISAIMLIIAVVLMSLGFAWRETMARLTAESARMREVAMRESISRERLNAEAQGAAAQLALGELYTTNGLWAARMNLYGESLLWLAQAADHLGDNSQFAPASQTRCLSWLPHCPVPIAALKLPKLSPKTVSGDWPIWGLSTSHDEVMFMTDNDFGIWRFDIDEIWRPAGQELQVTAAVWSEDGSSLALGDVDGKVSILDAATKSARASAELASSIACLSYSHSGKWLAAVAGKQLSLLHALNGRPSSFTWSLADEGTRVIFAEDDSKIAVVTRDHQVSVFHLDDQSTEVSPQPVFQFRFAAPDPQVAAKLSLPEFSADGTKIIVPTQPYRAQVFDLSSGQPFAAPLVIGTVHSFAMSDNKTYCVAGGDNYARVQTILWASNGPQFVRHHNRLTHQDAVTRVAFGGQDLIATAGSDQVVHLWNIGQERSPGSLHNDADIPLATLQHTDQIAGILFPQHSHQLVTVQYDGLVRVFELPDFRAPGYVMQSTPGGSVIKLVDADRMLMAGTTHAKCNAINASLRRIKDGVVIAETPLHGLRERGHLLDAVVTDDQTGLISLHANPARSGGTMLTKDRSAGSIVVWDFLAGVLKAPPIYLPAEPRSVALHPNGKSAAVLTVDQCVYLVDVQDGTIMDTLVPADKPAKLDFRSGLMPSQLFNGQLLFDADGTILIAWGIGTGFHAWDVATKRPKFATELARDWRINKLALSSDGRRLAIAIEKLNQVVLIDAQTGQVVRTIDHSANVDSVAFSSTGKEIVTACSDGRARIFDVDTGSRLMTDLVHTKAVLDATFSLNGAWVATLTSDRRVYVWNRADGQWALKPTFVADGTRQLLFSQDSQYIMTMGNGRRLQVLDLTPFGDFEALSLPRVRQLGELLTSKSIGEGGIVSLTSAEWMERWQLFKASGQ